MVSGDAPSPLLSFAPEISLWDAVLIDGAAGHYLDYDDSARSLHVSVPLAPALVAIGYRKGIPLWAIGDAFIAGAEVELELDRMLVPKIDRMGWHTTSVLGTFGAAAAASQVLKVPLEKLPAVIGAAAVQAAGIIWAFGKELKCFQAGKAALNGLIAATVGSAVEGVSEDALAGPAGFFATHLRKEQPPIELFQAYATPEVLFKLHASCHGTHAVIDAVSKLRRSFDAPLASADIELLEPLWCIDDAQTGLQSKFSARACAAYALLGWDTSDPGLYTESALKDPRVQELLGIIRVKGVPDDSADGWAWARVTCRLVNGRVLSETMDTRRLCKQPFAARHAAVRDKFIALAGPTIGKAEAESYAQRFLRAFHSQDLLPNPFLSARA